MSRGQVLEIARWEFLRYFKVRDLVITVLLIAGISGASFGLSWWQNRSLDPVDLAVIAPGPVTATSPRLRLEPHPPEALPDLREALAGGELDGILVLDDAGARLIAEERPSWYDEAAATATAALQAMRLERLGVTAEDLAAALAPAELELELTIAPRADGAARGVATLLIGLMLALLFFGLTYLFMSITGEKQQRVSEQMFVMVPAQAIIDGKLLGLSAMALVVMVQTVGVGAVAYELFSGGLAGWLGGAFSGVDVLDLVILVAFAAAGFAFWFALCAAWFATINDPHSSARSNALMLPFLPMSAVFIGLSDPDTVMMQVLSYLPITSMTVMPARVVLTEISPLAALASLALLVAAAFWLRRVAARVFEAAMLMYGKEPGLGEMLRWVRRSDQGSSGATRSR